MSLKIILEVIPHEKQRLNEQGDWWWDGDTLQVRASELGDWRYNFLLLAHEMDEAVFCRYNHITTTMVDQDQIWASQHPEIENNPDSFSGYPGSCLQVQHNDALALEWIRSRILGVNWQDYGDAYSAYEPKLEKPKTMQEFMNEEADEANN